MYGLYFLPVKKDLFKVNNKSTKTSSEYLSAGHTVYQNESDGIDLLSLQKQPPEVFCKK